MRARLLRKAEIERIYLHVTSRRIKGLNSSSRSSPVQVAVGKVAQSQLVFNQNFRYLFRGHGPETEGPGEPLFGPRFPVFSTARVLKSDPLKSFGCALARAEGGKDSGGGALGGEIQ